MVERKQMGRPHFKPTRAQRTSVERMRAVGDALDTIARALGIDRNTLSKHFAEEISTGAARQRLKSVNWVFDGASKGNAALVRRAEEMTRAAAAEIGEQEQPAAPKPAKPGKREVQHKDALAAGQGSEWAEDLEPLPGAGRLN